MTYESRLKELKSATRADTLRHRFNEYADMHQFFVLFLNKGGFSFNSPPLISDDDAFDYALDLIKKWEQSES
jgi:hypothetical protein